MPHPEALNLREVTRDKVTIAKRSSLDNYGQPVAGASTTYNAVVREKATKMLDKNGQEVVARHEILLITSDDIDATDILTLPAGFTPQSPPIIRVEAARDGWGVHHVKVYC